MPARPTRRCHLRLAPMMRACAARSSLALAFCAAFALVGQAGVTAPLGVAQASAAPLELIPAYFGPEGSPDPWPTMCEAAPAGSTVILNPDNGPVKKDAHAYAGPMRACEAHGQQVIGYVYTKYGRRSLAKVEKAIADYYSWFPGIEGIFLDEMAEVATARVETYYKQLAAYVHKKDGFVVGNPGDTATTAWQLGAADEVVTFEGSAAAYSSYSPPPWVLAARAQQIANIIFAAPEISQMQADCVKAQNENTGSIYVTNLPEKPNPYETLPAYWTTETASC
jgi:hypothetical protein